MDKEKKVKTLSQWIEWKQENKKAYLRLVNLSMFNGILIGILLHIIYLLIPFIT